MPATLGELLEGDVGRRGDSSGGGTGWVPADDVEVGLKHECPAIEQADVRGEREGG